jgi:hypothetical protein
MPLQNRHEMNAWQEYFSHEMEFTKALHANFNVPNIHLMVHWVEQLCLYRAVQQYSSESHEQAHNSILKDSWNASNHNLNYLTQLITLQHHILCIEI